MGFGFLVFLSLCIPFIYYTWSHGIFEDPSRSDVRDTRESKKKAGSPENTPKRPQGDQHRQKPPSLSNFLGFQVPTFSFRGQFEVGRVAVVFIRHWLDGPRGASCCASHGWWKAALEPTGMWAIFTVRTLWGPVCLEYIRRYLYDEYRTKLGMTKVVLRGSWGYHHCKTNRGPP